jgi:hypothetical protein
MKKILTAVVAAATLGVAVLATSGTAEARWGRGWGWRGPGPVIGGFVAGAVVGSALAAPYYYPYGYYGPYPYGPCTWRTVWNGYRWVRACY